MNNITKIKRLSLILKWLTISTMVALPILSMLFWINIPEAEHVSIASYVNNTFYNFGINFIPHGMKTPEHFYFSTKLIGFLVSLIPLLIIETVLFFMLCLFSEFNKENIFNIDNIKFVRRIAYTLIIGQAISPIYDLLMSANLSWHTANPIASISFGSSNIIILAISLLVLIISWVLSEAYKMQKEQAYTV